MCGMVHVMRKDDKPAWKAVLRRYRHQKARGSSGFGYVAIKDNQVVSYQRAETEHEIVRLISKEKAPEIMFHHRQPSGTPNVTELAHPFLIENEMLTHQYYIQHNGIIRNTEELKTMHDKMGFEYSSEMLKAYVTKLGEQHVIGIEWNDSESLAVETALALDGKKTTIDTEGAVAVIGLQVQGKQIINRFFFRNVMNPLKYHEDKQMVTITSAGHGQMVDSLKIYRLKQGGGFEILSGDITPPLSYKPTPYNKETRKGNWVWLNGKMVQTTEEESPNMGYLREGLNKVSGYLGLGPAEDDYDPYPRESEYQSLAATEEEENDYDSMELISKMDLNELWAEWDLCVAKKEELEKKIDFLEVASKNFITLEKMANLDALREVLDQHEAWMELLDKEIQRQTTEEPDPETVQERLMK